jgi:MFS family permease
VPCPRTMCAPQMASPPPPPPPAAAHHPLPLSPRGAQADTEQYILYLGLGGLVCLAFMTLKPTGAIHGPRETDREGSSSGGRRVRRLAVACWSKCGPQADPPLLLASLIVTAVGAALACVPLTPASLPTLTAAFVLIWSVGAPVSDVLAASLYSAMATDAGQSQGSVMGYITAAGSLGRIAFPLMFGIMPRAATMAFAALASIACAVALAVYMRRHARSMPPSVPQMSDSPIVADASTAVEPQERGDQTGRVTVTPGAAMSRVGAL